MVCIALEPLRGLTAGLGITKEYVRQVQIRALATLRLAFTIPVSP